MDLVDEVGQCLLGAAEDLRATGIEVEVELPGPAACRLAQPAPRTGP
ncbi:hypothetical protein [Actinomyces israelii]|nr:hypothetical protein [Actinomyces israelii]